MNGGWAAAPASKPSTAVGWIVGIAVGLLVIGLLGIALVVGSRSATHSASSKFTPVGSGSRDLNGGSNAGEDPDATQESLGPFVPSNEELGELVSAVAAADWDLMDDVEWPPGSSPGTFCADPRETEGSHSSLWFVDDPMEPLEVSVRVSVFPSKAIPIHEVDLRGEREFAECLATNAGPRNEAFGWVPPADGSLVSTRSSTGGWPTSVIVVEGPDDGQCVPVTVYGYRQVEAYFLNTNVTSCDGSLGEDEAVAVLDMMTRRILD